jgi:3-phenylpropionate/trans-cinnamate dioxygenase ferredoxin reductase component
MLSTDLLVVGGGPGGVGAVRGFRKHHGRGGVVFVSAEHALPYTRPALSKEFLRGDANAEDLPIEAPEFYGGVDLHLGATVIALDTSEHVATLGDGTEVHYRSCVLATGSDPKSLPVPGGGDPRLYLLRSLASAHRLRTAARATDAAIVLGSGFIGCEAAVSLARRGLTVTIVSPERVPQETRLGEYAGQRILAWLAEEGVRTVMGAEIVEIHDGHRVRLGGSHEPLTAGLVLSGGGITPQINIARTAGLSIDDGRVLVDDRMLSSTPDIYAVGDAALAINRTAGRRLAVEHWGEAVRMGEIAGANAGGGDEHWDDVPGFWTQIGDRVLKYVAWGDGFDDARVVEGPADSFTVWYGRDGVVVGALTYQADDDYERAVELIEQKARLSSR